MEALLNERESTVVFFVLRIQQFLKNRQVLLPRLAENPKQLSPLA